MPGFEPDQVEIRNGIDRTYHVQKNCDVTRLIDNPSTAYLRMHDHTTDVKYIDSLLE